MPAENIDTISVQNNNSPVEATVHLLPNLKVNMTDGEILNESDEFLSNNESKDCFKRPLTDKLVNSEKIKKIKLVENINEEELEDNSLKNLNQNKNTNDNFNMVMHKMNEITVSIENKVLNEEVNDSNEAIEDNKNNACVNLISDNDKIVGQDQKANLAIKKTICKEVKEDTNNHKRVNNSNDHNNCFTANIENNSDIDLNHDLNLSNRNSELNKSLSDKLVIVDNSDHEISQLSEFLDNNDLIKTTELNIKESKVKINESETENGTKKENKTTIENIIKVIEIDHDNNNDKDQENVEQVNINEEDSEIIVSDSNSDILDDEDEITSDEMVEEVFKQVEENFDEKRFSYFLKLFETSPMLFKQFDSYCTQKVISIITEKGDMGEIRSKLHTFNSKEKYWYQKCRDLEKKIKELKNLVDLHNKDLMIDKNARPLLCRRTVGLQACITTLNESNIVQVPNLSIQQSVDITTDDDEDDIIDLDSVEFSPKPSTSKTTGTSNRQLPPLSIITPTPPPPNIIKPSTVLLSNIVSPRIMNITNDNGTIDLTESDDNIIDITNTKNVEKSPIKIVKNQTINACNIKSGTSPQLTRNLSAQVVPTSVTLIEIPKLPTSSSSYVVSTGSSQLSTNLNPRSSSRTVRPVLTSDGRIVSIQIAPRTIQPAAIAYTAHQLPRPSTVTGSLLPGPSTVSGSLLPVPPAIPIYNHPARLPPLPAQRSLPHWKKIPPPPVVSIVRNPTDNHRGLVLEWNMCLNNSIADISTYQIYAYHEVDTELPSRENWKQIGEVNALPLPMACSLTQLAFDENYHFAVRAVDIHSRFGPFSDPKSLYNTI